MRVLVVAFGSSVHTARWVSQFEGCKWDIHLFPVDHFYLHPDLRNITVHGIFRNKSNHIHQSVKQSTLWWPFDRGRRRLLNALQRLNTTWKNDGTRLARIIRELRPDIIHSMDIAGGIHA